MEKNKIQELVSSFMDKVGIQLVSEDEGVWRAKIPEAQRSFFNGYEDLQFTFDRETAEKHREIELICEGSYLLRKIIDRLVEIPKVSRLFGVSAPELPCTEPGKGGELRVLTPGKVHYRQQVAFNFKVCFKSDLRQEKLYTALADPAISEITLKEGFSDLNLAKYQESPDPAIPIEQSDEEILRLYLQACRKLESILEDEIRVMQAWGEKQYKQEMVKVQEYLEEQKRELQKKKESVCFHLYFFQKEEEIDRVISDLEVEHTRKIEEIRDKFKLKVEISLINAVVLCIPTWGVAASQFAKKKREAASPRFSVEIPRMGVGPAI